MPEQTMLLRDAARQLALIKNPKAKGINSTELRSLLRAGELCAGFYILDGTAWIDIPVDYWLRTDAPTMHKITKEGGESYKLKPSKFPEQVANIIRQLPSWGSPSADRRVADESLVRLISSIGISYEVTIKTIVFNDYLERRKITLPAASATSNGVGRRQKESWPTLCSYVGAYFGAHCRDLPQRPIKIEAASKRILELAEGDKIEDLPDWTTLKAHVSTAVRLLKTPRFKIE